MNGRTGFAVNLVLLFLTHERRAQMKSLVFFSQKTETK